jgi:hypothetical protein
VQLQNGSVHAKRSGQPAACTLSAVAKSQRARQTQLPSGSVHAKRNGQVEFPPGSVQGKCSCQVAAGRRNAVAKWQHPPETQWVLCSKHPDGSGQVAACMLNAVAKWQIQNADPILHSGPRAQDRESGAGCISFSSWKNAFRPAEKAEFAEVQSDVRDGLVRARQGPKFRRDVQRRSAESADRTRQVSSRVNAECVPQIIA